MKWIRQLPLVLLFASATCGEVGLGQTARIQEQTQAELNMLRKSANNLKVIGLAFHTYHDARRSLPAAAIYGPEGKALLSWRVALLPYLGDKEQALYKQFKLDEAWDSEHNKKLLDQMPDVFKSPTAKGKTNQTPYQVIAGPDTLFTGPKGVKLQSIADGTSNTILAVEATPAVPWTKPADVVYDAKKPLPKFGGVARSGFTLLLCDGSTLLVRPDFDEQTFRHAITPRGGEVLDFRKLSR